MNKQQNQYGSLEQREERFKIEFENKFPLFKYLDGYTTREEPFKCICRKCNTIKEVNGQCVKKSNKQNLRCKQCYVEEIKARNIKRKTNDKKQALLFKRIKSIIKEIQKEIEKESKQIKIVCGNCNKLFTTNISSKRYCSKQCFNQNVNRKKSNKKDKRRTALRIKGITLERLIKRDNNICYICKRICNENDYEIKDNNFIVGKDYPSIDHIISVYKGGLHDWDNIKLAHHYCNTMKGIKEIDANLLK